MATFGGDGFYFAIDNSGGSGTLKQLDGVRSVTGLPGVVAHSRSTAIGDTIEKSHPRVYDIVFTIEGAYDDTASTGSATVLPSIFAEQQANPTRTYTFEYGPEGNTAGEPKHTGECKVMSYEEPSRIDDIILFRAQFRAQTYSFTTF